MHKTNEEKGNGKIYTIDFEFDMSKLYIILKQQMYLQNSVIQERKYIFRNYQEDRIKRIFKKNDKTLFTESQSHKGTRDKST